MSDIFEEVKDALSSAYEWAVGNDDAEAVSSSPADVSLGTGMAEGAKQEIMSRQEKIDQKIECAINGGPNC